MAKTVVGLMNTAEEAQSVVRELVESGFERGDIGMMTGPSGRDASAHAAGDTSSTTSGALTGAGTGAALGGVAGLVVGLAALPIPGIGPIIAAGPLAAALAGAGVGAVAGGLIGVLTNMGVPDEEAHYYAEGVKRGGTLVTVNVRDDEMAEVAAEIMREHGAVDIDERAGRWKEEGWSGRLADDEDADVPSTVRGSASSAASRSPSRADVSALTQDTRGRERDAGQVLPVVEEELRVGKRQVERGGVRVYSKVVDTPVEDTVTLREEHVEVERRPVDRALGSGHAAAFKETVIELRETAEEAVVDKRARITEEVVVTKHATEREETIRDTVRKTDVDIEKIGAGDPGRPGAGGMASKRGRPPAYTGPERRLRRGQYGGEERRVSD